MIRGGNRKQGAPVPRARSEHDPRVSMVLAVLAGRRLDDVARDGAVAVAVLDRWVRDFVVAGADVITGRPDADDAREREGV